MVQNIQFYQPPPRKPSFGAQLSQGIGNALNMGAQLVGQNQEKQKFEAQKKQLSQLTGMDLSQINDPKILEKAAELHMTGQNQLRVQELKNSGKKEQTENKQTFLNQLFGGNQSQPSQFSQQNQIGSPPDQDLTSEGGPQDLTVQPSQQKPSLNPIDLTDAQIAYATSIDPNLGRSLQHSKDVALREQRENRNFEASEIRAGKKEVTDSFNENKETINKIYDQYEDSLRKEAILDRTDQLDESGELSDSGMINFLESLGLAPEWLKNPANEEYNKLSLDLLGGGSLQADYGSRVLASEFKVSQQRIPTLSQTKEGRRQIKENIRTMLLPSRLKNERLQFYLDRAERTGEPLPHNLRGRILKDIKPQLEEAYDKFKQRNGRYPVKEGTEPDENSIEKYYFLSNGNEEKALKMMREDGYVTE